MVKVEVVDHPLAQHKLTLLRKEETSPWEFRRILEEVTYILFTKATEELSLTKVQIKTPLESTESYLLKNKIIVVPILRAGLGMLNPILALIPDIRVEFVGVKRDETSLKPEEYYAQLPRIDPDTVNIVIDPMLATGGSMVHTIHCLSAQGARNFIVITLITTPEAIDNLKKEEEDIRLFTASVDRELNHRGFIMPGLGDAGDRLFGTF